MNSILVTRYYLLEPVFKNQQIVNRINVNRLIILKTYVQLFYSCALILKRNSYCSLVRFSNLTPFIVIW